MDSKPPSYPTVLAQIKHLVVHGHTQELSLDAMDNRNSQIRGCKGEKDVYAG